MATEKVAGILRVKSDFSEEQIQAMSDNEAWAWVYQRQERPNPKRNQICFTGFSLSIRAELEAKAIELLNLEVKDSVSKGLHYLCIGPNPGPAKVAKAKEQGTILISAEQFASFAETGELPIGIFPDEVSTDKAKCQDGL